MKIIRPITVNDAALTASNVSATTAAAWSSGTTYALGDRVQVDATDSHLIYESLQGSNTNHSPATSPTWWVEVGATNRWAMFDGASSTQTSNADSIEVTIQATGRVNAVALLNVSASSARVTMTDATDGIVYDRTVDLVWDSGITDWWAYFFEPIIRTPDVAFADLPPYSDAEIGITLAAAGETVACGVCVLGLVRQIGDTQAGAQLGIQDYSLITTDDFGTRTITERAYAKKATFSVVVDGADVDEIHRTLAAYRATPLVYIGSERFSQAIVYGFYRDFSIAIAYPTYAVCNLDLEGLI